jgi:hypothetical protein
MITIVVLAILLFAAAPSGAYDVEDPTADHTAHAIDLDEAGDAAAALLSFRAAVQFGSGTAEVWSNLGIALVGDNAAVISRGSADEATRAFRQALRLQPGDDTASAELAALQAALRRHGRPEITEAQEQLLARAAGQWSAGDGAAANASFAAAAAGGESSGLWHQAGLSILAAAAAEARGAAGAGADDMRGMAVADEFAPVLRASGCFQRALHLDPNGWRQRLGRMALPQALLRARTPSVQALWEETVAANAASAGPGGLNIVAFTKSNAAHLPLLANMLAMYKSATAASRAAAAAGGGQAALPGPFPLVLALDAQTMRWCEQRGVAAFPWYRFSTRWARFVHVEEASQHLNWEGEQKDRARTASGNPYYVLMQEKTRMFVTLLAGGYSFLYIDTDIALRHDPLPLLLPIAQSRASDGPFHIGNCDHEPEDGPDARFHILNNGFIFFKGSSACGDGRALALWTETLFAIHLEADPFKEYSGHEQLYEQYLVNNAMRRRGDPFSCLPFDADGNKCRHDHESRPLTAADVVRRNPVHLHASCLKGFDKKVQWLAQIQGGQPLRTL